MRNSASFIRRYRAGQIRSRERRPHRLSSAVLAGEVAYKTCQNFMRARNNSQIQPSRVLRIFAYPRGRSGGAQGAPSKFGRRRPMIELRKIAQASIAQSPFVLFDNGVIIAAVSRFLDLLCIRGVSANTLRAYAFDLLAFATPSAPSSFQKASLCRSFKNSWATVPSKRRSSISTYQTRTSRRNITEHCVLSPQRPERSRRVEGMAQIGMGNDRDNQ